MVLEAQRGRVRPWERGLGVLLCSLQCRMLQFLAAQTETETEWPGELSEEQTAISLFRDKGLDMVTSVLTLRRDA